jgi:hypothetical protein
MGTFAKHPVFPLNVLLVQASCIKRCGMGLVA